MKVNKKFCKKVNVNDKSRKHEIIFYGKFIILKKIKLIIIIWASFSKTDYMVRQFVQYVTYSNSFFLFFKEMKKKILITKGKLP